MNKQLKHLKRVNRVVNDILHLEKYWDEEENLSFVQKDFE